LQEIDGTLGNLRPQGLVRLTGGEVNLFTTQFRLARGYEQVEAVVDITDDFSVSISQVIAADDPTRYNLLYRINKRLRLRGSTNFSGKSRVLLEYEARFWLFDLCH
jgi:hypothetical protein